MTGTPHVNTEDVEYNGFLIPKNTYILPNAWYVSLSVHPFHLLKRDHRAIMHSEEHFARPWDFIPERFLGKDGCIDKSLPDSEMSAFGYGRRYVLASLTLFNICSSWESQHLSWKAFQ